MIVCLVDGLKDRRLTPHLRCCPCIYLCHDSAARSVLHGYSREQQGQDSAQCRLWNLLCFALCEILGSKVHPGIHLCGIHRACRHRWGIVVVSWAAAAKARLDSVAHDLQIREPAFSCCTSFQVFSGNLVQAPGSFLKHRLMVSDLQEIVMMLLISKVVVRFLAI